MDHSWARLTPSLGARADMNERAESQLDHLYGLPLDEFTTARNEAVKQARAEDPQAGDILAKARKPTVAAWAVNQLARREPEQIRTLLRTADRLRAADSAQALRRTAHDQREVLDGLIRSLRSHFDDLGARTVDQVRETLQAATIDDEARGLLERGRFTKEQQAVGFVALAEQEGSAGRAATASHEARHSRRRQAAEQKLAAAHDRTSKARSELERAVAEAREAKKAVEAAQAALARAERQEAQARSQLDKAD